MEVWYPTPTKKLEKHETGQQQKKGHIKFVSRKKAVRLPASIEAFREPGFHNLSAASS
jgi:hypothetical protein